MLRNDTLQVPSTSQNQLPDQYDDMIQFRDGKKGTWTRSRSVSCVSMVYNNTAQAALHTVGPFGRHKWSPIPDQTDPPGGNHICSILSEGGVKRKLQKKSQKRHMKHRRREDLVKISARHIRMVSSTLSNVCCVINRISSSSHSPDCHGPHKDSPKLLWRHPTTSWLHLEVPYKQSYFPHDER